VSCRIKRGLFRVAALLGRGGEDEIQQKESGSMMDIVLIGIGVLFFALSFAYTRACDRL
jgi:hypothetical protein